MNGANTTHGVKFWARSALVTFFTLVSAGRALALEPGPLAVPTPALVLYDNFTAPKISPTKWFGGEGHDDLGLESKRGISNGQLQLTTRSVGFTASNAGVGTNFVFLAHPNPDDVTAMKATITVSGLSTPGCAANTDPIQGSFAVLEGAFFNAGSPTNGDQTNDVLAAVGISRSSLNPAGPLGVVAFVIQCMDKHCSADTATSLGSTQLGGAVAIGTPVKVTMQWDQPNHRFLFFRGAQQPATVDYGALGVSDVESAGLPFKGLEAFNNVANCMPPATQPIENITALFDNVFVNP